MFISVRTDVSSGAISFSTERDSSCSLILIGPGRPSSRRRDPASRRERGPLTSWRFVGPRRSSVFPTPPRAILEADSYESAHAHRASPWGARNFKEEIKDTDVELLDEFDGHPSVRKLISNGYQILTF